MSYLAVPLVIFVFWAVPAAPSDPLPALFVIMVLAACSAAAGLQGLSLALVECAALLLAVLRFMPDASPSYGIEAHAVRAVIAEAQQDSVQRRYRSVGFRATLVAAEDGEGMLSSASGSVYVISSQADAASGDRLYLPGRVSGPVFYADGAVLISHSPLSSIRVMMRSAIRERLSVHGEAGELALRLILGTGEWGMYEAGDAARMAGLAHVLALSGMHLSILAMIASRMLFFLPSKVREAAIVCFLAFFTFLSGMRPSLLRAFIYRLALRFSSSGEDGFALSALILFAFYPEAAVDLGAQFSFIALGGIFLLSGAIDEGIRTLLPIPYRVSSAVSSSMAALLFSIPLTVMAFGSYTLGSIITTMPANALVTAYMGVSLAVLAFPPLGIVMELLFMAASAFFSLAAAVPMADDMVPYAVMAAASLFLAAVGSIRSRIANKVPIRVS